jgi:hypothetical protein
MARSLGKETAHRLPGRGVRPQAVRPTACGGVAPSKERTLHIWVLGTVAAVALVPGTLWIAQMRDRARAAAEANAIVAQKVEAARRELAVGRSDEAVTLLQDALTTEAATDLAEATDLLEQVRTRQADALLAAAESAIERRDGTTALRQLEQYLADPHGREHERAARLHGELELVLYDVQARAHLSKLSDAALENLARRGALAEVHGISTPGVRAIYLDVLRRHLPAEVWRRQEAYAVREGRIRVTPVYRELWEFVARTRKQYAAASTDGALFEYLFEELGVTNLEQQRKLFAELRAGQERGDDLEAVISAKRANVKERFRTYREFDQTDVQVFDWLVDQMLDGLLKELGAAPIR